MFPNWRVEQGIEFVVQREEITNFTPDALHHLVVNSLHGRRRNEAAMLEVDHEISDLLTYDHQRRGFERFDESASVPDGENVVHPRAAIKSRPKFHHTQILGELRIFPFEFLNRRFIGNRLRREDVPTVDEMLMLDLPGPT